MAASKGLGFAVARELVAEGANVVISSRSMENLEAAQERIRDDTSADEPTIEPIVCDLTEEQDIRQCVNDAVSQLGGLDILITNHGGPPSVSFEESTVTQLDGAYEMVLRSTYVMVEEALPYLSQGEGGAITNIVSASAREAPRTHLISNMTRPGIYGLSKTIAKDYGDEGVRSNCICPRLVMTDRIQEIFKGDAERTDRPLEEIREEHLDSLAVNRFGDPEEFAKLAVMLSSDVCDYVTGSIVTVDGGWTESTY